MGLFRKPSTDAAPASTVVQLQYGANAVEWHGETGLLVRSPHIYLDWAVNKDRRRSALEHLDAIYGFLEVTFNNGLGRGPWQAPFVAPLNRSVEVTVAYTAAMRCKVAFRPRSAIADCLYPTFWALWNELVRRVEPDDAEAMGELAVDLVTQINHYRQSGIGGRGGIAPLYSAQVGAGQRLEQEIAEFAGITVDEFRSVPDAERDEILARHAEAQVARIRHQRRHPDHRSHQEAEPD
jgi:hypothetical protein